MDASSNHSSTYPRQVAPWMSSSANDTLDKLRADPVLLTPQERLAAFGKLLLRAMERRKRQSEKIHQLIINTNPS